MIENEHERDRAIWVEFGAPSAAQMAGLQISGREQGHKEGALESNIAVRGSINRRSEAWWRKH
jgi:hypothetical protein